MREQSLRFCFASHRKYGTRIILEPIFSDKLVEALGSELKKTKGIPKEALLGLRSLGEQSLRSLFQFPSLLSSIQGQSEHSCGEPIAFASAGHDRRLCLWGQPRMVEKMEGRCGGGWWEGMSV